MNIFNKLFINLKEESKKNQPAVSAPERIKTTVSLVQYLRRKENDIKGLCGVRNCPVDGFLSGIDDAIKVVEKNVKYEFYNGLNKIRDSIANGKGLEHPYPLHNTKIPLWSRAYVAGVGVVLEWISEYKNK